MKICGCLGKCESPKLQLRAFSVQPSKDRKPKKYVHILNVFPALFKVGIMYLQLILIVCKFCQSPFYMCRCCFRNHIYCCKNCRYQARRLSHQKAQARYQKTDKGRNVHRQAAVTESNLSPKKIP